MRLVPVPPALAAIGDDSSWARCPAISSCSPSLGTREPRVPGGARAHGQDDSAAGRAVGSPAPGRGCTIVVTPERCTVCAGTAVLPQVIAVHGDVNRLPNTPVAHSAVSAPRTSLDKIRYSSADSYTATRPQPPAPRPADHPGPARRAQHHVVGPHPAEPAIGHRRRRAHRLRHLSQRGQVIGETLLLRPRQRTAGRVGLRQKASATGSHAAARAAKSRSALSGRYRSRS